MRISRKESGIYNLLCVWNFGAKYTSESYFNTYAPINVSPPLPGEVGQSWGFDLIRIQLPHPPGYVRIQILTGHALRAFCMRTLAIQYPDPWGKPAIPNKGNSPPCPGWGGGGGLTLIGTLFAQTLDLVLLITTSLFFKPVGTSKIGWSKTQLDALEIRFKMNPSALEIRFKMNPFQVWVNPCPN